MNPRELLILLLGLAIVAVVLRGLYVAIQARRGQIRLAIDKNIPGDVDLDALEMAELPGGGARVKPRGAAHPDANAEVQRATARANAMDLGDDVDDAVPVLMDAVQVRGRAREAEAVWDDDEEFPTSAFADADAEAEARATPADDWTGSPLGVAAQTGAEALGQEEPEPGQTDWAAEDYEEFEEYEQYEEDEEDEEIEDGVIGAARTVILASSASADEEALDSADEEALEEDPDAVLLDYEADGLAALAPDYNDTSGEDETTDCRDDYGSEESEASMQSSAAASATADEQDWEPDMDDDVEDELAAEEARPEPRVGSFDDSLEEFSMSAGERIGFEGKPRPIPAKQTGLFDNVDEGNGRAAKRAAAKTDSDSSASGSKRKSLFAAFRRKKPAEEVARGAHDKAAAHKPEPSREAVTRPTPKPAPPPAPRSAEIMPLDSHPPSTEETEAESAPHPEPHPATDSEQAMPAEPSEVLVINVMASHGRKFAGDDLMRVLITSGLKFGEMNIFHQRLGNQAKGPVVFSVANMLNPGTFDLNNMESFRTVGVSLFLALPTAINNLDAFEKMLAVARQLCDALGGELKDDNRNGMTAQTIEHYRQRVRDFELRQLKAAGSRG